MQLLSLKQVTCLEIGKKKEKRKKFSEALALLK